MSMKLTTHEKGDVIIVRYADDLVMGFQQRADAVRFLGEFKDGGGTGIEVVTSSHTGEQFLEYAILAKEFGFLASRGSDFHGPGESRVDLGKLPNLAADLKPVWHDW